MARYCTCVGIFPEPKARENTTQEWMHVSSTGLVVSSARAISYTLQNVYPAETVERAYLLK